MTRPKVVVNLPASSRVRAHIFLSGQVRDVRLRQHVQQQAQTMGLTGWVRHLLDGRVEAILEGEEQLVRQVINRCCQGKLPGQIENVDIDYENPTGDFDRFLITW